MVATSGVGFTAYLYLMSLTLLGMPPGARDEALVRCAPREAMVYVEWSERGLGKEGAPGIDGLAADPEIRQFLGDVEKSLGSFVKEQAVRAPDEARTIAQHAPALVHAILTRPGCLFASFDAPGAQAAIEKAGRMSEKVIFDAVTAGVVINGGEQADAIDRAIRGILSTLPQPPAGGDLKNVPVRLPGAPFELLLHRQDKYFILGLGQKSVEGAIAGLAGRSKGLSENARFAAGAGAETGRTADVGWIDVKAIREAVGTMAGPARPMVERVVHLSGIDEVDSVFNRTYVSDGQIHATCLIATKGNLPGVLALAGGRAIRQQDFAGVPADCDLVAAVSLNAPKIYEEIERVVGAASPEALERMHAEIKRTEDQLGLRLKEDVFAAFGDVWTLHDSPADGGLLVTSLVAELEVRDPAKAKSIVDRMVQLIRSSIPGEHGIAAGRRRSGVVLEERQFLAHTIYFANTIGEDFPFAPAFCLTEGRLVAALHPQALKAHLRFLKSKGAAFQVPASDQRVAGEQALIGYLTFDSKFLTRILYAFAPYAGQMLASRLQQEGMTLDVYSLPSARAILPYLGETSWKVTRTGKGILLETRSASPIPLAEIAILGTMFFSRTLR